MSRPFADADVFRAIADPTRRRVLDLLRVRPRSASELRGRIRKAPSTVSAHLRVLRSTGLIAQRRVGRSRHYELDQKRMRAIETWIRAFSDR